MKRPPPWSTVIGNALVLFVVAIPLSYAWELGQRPLYVGMADDPYAWWHCFLASLGDGMLILIIYGIGNLVFGRSDWFVRPDARRVGFVLLSGLMVGLAVEWAGVRIMHRWAYTDAMPQIPGWEVGFVPVLQMMLIPLAVFGLVRMLRLPR